MSVTNYKDRVLPPVASEDLVDANGACAGAAAGAGVIPAAIALEMTECDVVKRAGIAERAEIGTSERGERTADTHLHQRSAARHLLLHGRTPDHDGARA